MEKEVFKFHVRNLAYGWCRVLMLINDKEIEYNAEYLGPNPLASFIDACAELMDNCSKYHVKWLYHDKALVTEMRIGENDMLFLDISEQEQDFSKNRVSYIKNGEEWHESIPFNDFVKAISTEGFRVLNAFGLYGYYRSWQNHEEFPLANLLRISGDNKETWKGDSCSSYILEEMELIKENIKLLDVTKETKMKECIIYYESWQLQCCGDPFKIGDKVEWSCTMPIGHKNAHGVVVDFEEEHHGFSTHSITGTVSKIIVERSEFPKAKREVWYDRAQTIHEEIQYADGWETNKKDNETTEYTLWGYIVELKDVTVKPDDLPST